MRNNTLTFLGLAASQIGSEGALRARVLFYRHPCSSLRRLFALPLYFRVHQPLTQRAMLTLCAVCV